MKLVRCDLPEVACCAASARARASLHAPALAAPLVYGFFPNVLILLIALALGLVASARETVCVGVPALLAWNGYVLWCMQSSRRNWIIAGCTDRVYLRLFAWRRRGRGDAREPDVAVLEASEIASVTARTVEVFLYGPKPKIVEWLVIEPDQAVAEGVTDRVRRVLGLPDPRRSVYVAIEEGRLVIEWKWYRPALRTFLRHVAREFPSLVVGNEERSELDLNRIWSSISMNLSARQRQVLAQAIRLGFGCECQRLLCRYKYISLRESKRYLAELVREETGRGQPAVRG
jgi:hypothetical protein